MMLLTGWNGDGGVNVAVAKYKQWQSMWIQLMLECKWQSGRAGRCNCSLLLSV